MSTIFETEGKPENATALAIPDWDKTLKDIEIELELPLQERQRIDEWLEESRREGKNLDEYAKLCVNFIRSSEKGIDETNKNSGFFKRIWRGITGKGEETKLQTLQDLANAQKACVQMVASLGKLGALQQAHILQLQNLIQYTITEDKEFKKMLREHLNKIFARLKERLELHERIIKETITELNKDRNRIDFHQLVLENVDRKLKEHGDSLQSLNYRTDYLLDLINKVEKALGTIEWVNKLDAYDSRLYHIESKIERFFEAIFSFYTHKRGEFSYGDLMLFSSGLRKLGFDIHEKITIDQFLRLTIEHILSPKNSGSSEGSVESKRLIARLRFSTDTDIVLAPYDKNQDRFTPFTQALNAVLLTSGIRDIAGADVWLETLKNLDRLAIDSTSELDWFRFAEEILSHLQWVDNQTMLEKNLSNWSTIWKQVENRVSIESSMNDLRDLLFKPMLAEINNLLLPRPAFSKGSVMTGLIDTVSKQNASDLKPGSDSVFLEFPLYTDRSPHYCKFEVIAREKKLTLRYGIAVGNTGQLQETHDALSQVKGIQQSEDGHYVFYFLTNSVSEKVALANMPKVIASDFMTLLAPLMK